jgi:hypothetical protein
VSREKINPAEILKSLTESKEELALAIVEARAKCDAANNELRALQSLEKLRAIRDGELKRKSPRPKTKPAVEPAVEPKALVGRPSHRQRIGNWLRENGPAKPHIIAVGLGIASERVIEELEGDPHTFRRQSVNEQPGWGLA